MICYAFLQELLTEALAAEWTPEQAVVLERTEGAESVVDAVQRVASNTPQVRTESFTSCSYLIHLLKLSQDYILNGCPRCPRCRERRFSKTRNLLLEICYKANHQRSVLSHSVYGSALHMLPFRVSLVSVH